MFIYLINVSVGVSISESAPEEAKRGCGSRKTGNYEIPSLGLGIQPRSIHYLLKFSRIFSIHRNFSDYKEKQ